MKTPGLETLLLIAAAAIGLSACSANLCQRKDDFFKNHCAGTSITYSADPLCEQNLERCSPAHLAQLEGYVKCLESANECSLEAMGRCAQMFPGGVNLMCPGS